jgi:hypothetical protein
MFWKIHFLYLLCSVSNIKHVYRGTISKCLVRSYSLFLFMKFQHYLHYQCILVAVATDDILLEYRERC